MRTQRRPRRGSSQYLRAVAVLAAFAVVLVSCGGDEEAAPPEPTAAEGPDEEAADGDEAPAESADESPEEEPAEACEQTAEIRFSHILGETSFISAGVVWWTDQVTEVTDGRVTFEHFFGSSLLPPAEIISGLREGRAEGVYYSATFVPTDSPLASILSAAGLDSVPDVQARAFTELIETNEDLQAEFAENNGVAFATVPLSPYVYAFREPIDSLDDIDGLRIRVPGGMAQVFEEDYGVSTTFISSEEVYESVQRGVVDAVSFPFDLVVTTGVYEVAPHVAAFGSDVANSGTVVLRSDVYESLCQADQDAIANLTPTFLDEAFALMDEAENEACDALYESGGSSFLLPDDELQAFADNIGPRGLEAWKESVLEMGVDEDLLDGYIDEYLALQAKYTAELSDYVHPAARCAAAHGG